MSTIEEKKEFDKTTKESMEKLDNILKLFPSMSNLLVFFAVLIIKYHTGDYTITKFGREMNKLYRLIIEDENGDKKCSAAYKTVGNEK